MQTPFKIFMPQGNTERKRGASQDRDFNIMSYAMKVGCFLLIKFGDGGNIILKAGWELALLAKVFEGFFFFS